MCRPILYAYTLLKCFDCSVHFSVGGRGELYQSLFWIFGILFNFAKPLNL